MAEEALPDLTDPGQASKSLFGISSCPLWGSCKRPFLCSRPWRQLPCVKVSPGHQSPRVAASSFSTQVPVSLRIEGGVILVGIFHDKTPQSSGNVPPQKLCSKSKEHWLQRSRVASSWVHFTIENRCCLPYSCHSSQTLLHHNFAVVSAFYEWTRGAKLPYHFYQATVGCASENICALNSPEWSDL